MKGKWKAVVRLTRYKEYLCFVVVTTLLGAGAAQGNLGWKLLGVLVANWLAVGFSFMINDVEDAEDDCLTPGKAMRNPVSAKELSKTEGVIAAMTVGIAAGILYASLGIKTMLAGWFCLGLGYLYSWKKVRLKAVPVLDVISHGFMLAGLQLLAAVYAFEPIPVSSWLWPLIFVATISMYGQLFNEVRDFEGDRKAGVTHTANFIGKRWASFLMLCFLVLGSSTGVYTMLWVNYIPIWVLAFTGILAIAMVIKPVFLSSNAKSVIEAHAGWQKPVEIAAAIGLGTWFVGPWFLNLMS